MRSRCAHSAILRCARRKFAHSSMPTRWLGRASNGIGWTAGCYAPDTATPTTANSAVPLDRFADQTTIPAIVDWYRSRDLTPRLSVADRLLRLSDEGEGANWVLVRDVHPRARSIGPAGIRAERGAPARHTDRRADGRRRRRADLRHPCRKAAARASVTDSPDGIRWVGLSTIQSADPGAAHPLCEALLAWGASRGATRGYIRVRDGTSGAAARSLGFVLHHHARYITGGTHVGSQPCPRACG